MHSHLIQDAIAHRSIPKRGDPYTHPTDLTFGRDRACLGLHGEPHALAVGGPAFDEPFGALAFFFHDRHAEFGQGGMHGGPGIVATGVVGIAELALEVGIPRHRSARNPSSRQQAAAVCQDEHKQHQLDRVPISYPLGMAWHRALLRVPWTEQSSDSASPSKSSIEGAGDWAS